MSQARQGKGTLLQVETAPGSTVYVTIPECGDIKGPTLDSDEHEVTNQDTVGLGKEFLAGLVDPGSISTTINEVISNTYHRQLITDKQALTVRNYRKVWPTGNAQLFVGYVKTYDPTYPKNGPIQAAVTIRLTGLPGTIT